MARTCKTRWSVGVKRPGPGKIHWSVVSGCTSREVVQKLEARGDLVGRRRVYAGPIKLKRGERPYTS